MEDEIQDGTATEEGNAPEPQPAEPAEPSQSSSTASVSDPSHDALVRREARKLARRWIRQREAKRKETSEPLSQAPDTSTQQNQPAAAPQARRFVWERFRNAS